MDLSNVIDYLIIGFIAALIWKFLTKNSSELESIKEDSKKIVVLNITEVDQIFLVHKSDTKEFVFQTKTLEEILPKLKTTFVDTPIMFMSDDFRLLALFTMNEEKK
jgi:hypothetical protein